MNTLNSEKGESQFDSGKNFILKTEEILEIKKEIEFLDEEIRKKKKEIEGLEEALERNTSNQVKNRLGKLRNQLENKITDKTELEKLLEGKPPKVEEKEFVSGIEIKDVAEVKKMTHEEVNSEMKRAGETLSKMVEGLNEEDLDILKETNEYKKLYNYRQNILSEQWVATKKENMVKKSQGNPFEFRSQDGRKVVLVAGEESGINDSEEILYDDLTQEEKDLFDEEAEELRGKSPANILNAADKNQENLNINLPLDNTRGGRNTNMAKPSPDTNKGPKFEYDIENGEKGNETIYSSPEEEMDPIRREMIMDDEPSVKRIEVATGVSFELDTNMIKDLKTELTGEADQKKIDLARQFLEANGSDADKKLEGNFAISRVEELGGKEEIFSNEELRNLYALRMDLGEKDKNGVEKNNTLFSLKGRERVLDVLNEKSERLKAELDEAQELFDKDPKNAMLAEKINKKNTEYEKLFDLREKLTEKIVGKDFTEDVLARGVSEEAAMENKLSGKTEMAKRTILEISGYGLDIEKEAEVERYLNHVKDNSNISDEKEKDRYIEQVKDYIQGNKKEIKNQAEFIKENKKNLFIKNFITEEEIVVTKKGAAEVESKKKVTKEKEITIGNSYDLACLKKAGYDIKKEKSFWRKRISEWGNEKVILTKGGKKIEISAQTSKAELDKIMQDIQKEAEDIWKDEFMPDAKDEREQDVKDQKDAAMKELAKSPDEDKEEYFENLKENLKADILARNFYDRIKKKTPEQMKRLEKAYSGDEERIIDAINGAKDLLADIQGDKLSDENIKAINEYRVNHHMPEKDKKSYIEYDAKHKFNFKDVIRSKSEEKWIKWLFSIDFPIKSAENKANVDKGKNSSDGGRYRGQGWKGYQGW